MSFLNPWEEVYSSTDLSEVMMRDVVLRNHGIRCKTTDDSLRAGTEARGGLAGAALSRGGPQQTTYRLLVKHTSEQTARYYLSLNKN